VGIFGTVASGLNWIRIGLIAVIAVMLFGAGYQYSNTRHAKQDAKDAAATANEIARLSNEYTAKMRELALVAAENNRLMSADFAEIEMHRDSLIEIIETTELTKPVAEVRVESCIKGEENEIIVVANPFSDSFRVLYNQASRNLRPSGSEGADP
jgi:hypothetical protein